MTTIELILLRNFAMGKINGLEGTDKKEAQQFWKSVWNKCEKEIEVIAKDFLKEEI